jgi:uroporphyrin-III C-methyltransferase / precorrin-2 dehydrogenase / sirohydrochlorin ferrochelatase
LNTSSDETPCPKVGGLGASSGARVPPAERLRAFPVGWVTTGRTLLIAGGGPEARVRLRHALLFDWHRIVLVQPTAHPEILEAAHSDPRVLFHERAATEGDVISADLVLEDTCDRRTAEVVAGWCRKHRVPLNAMDKPDLCDIFYMSLVLRDGMAIAAGTGGEAPVLSGLLRQWLEKRVGPGWSAAAQLLGEARRRMAPGAPRMEALRGLARNPELLRRIEQNDVEGIRQLIDDAVRYM